MDNGNGNDAGDPFGLDPDPGPGDLAPCMDCGTPTAAAAHCCLKCLKKRVPPARKFTPAGGKPPPRRPYQPPVASTRRAGHQPCGGGFRVDRSAG